jgi:hypothetical protein
MFNLQSVIRCVSILAPPSSRLTVWLLKTAISRRIVTDELASGSKAVFTYCCHRWQMRSTCRSVINGCKLGSDFASAASTRACALWMPVSRQKQQREETTYVSMAASTYALPIASDNTRSNANVFLALFND